MLINELRELRHELIGEQSVLLSIISICNKGNGCEHKDSVLKILKNLNYHMDRTLNQLVETIDGMESENGKNDS